MIKFNLAGIASNNYGIITRTIRGTVVSAPFQFRKERYYGTQRRLRVATRFTLNQRARAPQGNADLANKDSACNHE